MNSGLKFVGYSLAGTGVLLVLSFLFGTTSMLLAAFLVALAIIGYLVYTGMGRLSERQHDATGAGRTPPDVTLSDAEREQFDRIVQGLRGKR